MLVSGGVDSSVCAALCREAVGPDRVHALHIDHGFMRHGAPPLVKRLAASVVVKIFRRLYWSNDFSKVR